MPKVGLGLLSYFGVGEESTYGTGVAPSFFTEINNESFQKAVNRIETNALIRRGIHKDRVQLGAIAITGSVEFDAVYGDGGFGKICKHAFGQIDTTSPDPTNAPTVRQHKFTIANSLPTGLSVEIYRDSSGFTTEPNKAFRYEGCRVNTLEFSCGVDEILRVTANFIGENEARVSKATDSYSSTEFAVYHQGNLTWGSTILPIENFTIQLNNNLELRPKLGSQLTREPMFAQKVEVTGTFTLEFDTWEQYDDFVNATTRQLDIDFLGDTIAASQKYQVRLLCGVADLRDVRILLNSPGRIRAEVDFKAYRQDNQQELEVFIKNISTGW